jgi:hypothetical protein
VIPPGVGERSPNHLRAVARLAFSAPAGRLPADKRRRAMSGARGSCPAARDLTAFLQRRGRASLVVAAIARGPYDRLRNSRRFAPGTNGGCRGTPASASSHLCVVHNETEMERAIDRCLRSSEHSERNSRSRYVEHPPRLEERNHRGLRCPFDSALRQLGRRGIRPPTRLNEPPMNSTVNAFPTANSKSPRCVDDP